MKSVLGCVAFVALMSSTAFAADIPAFEAPVVAPVPVVFTWTGPYVGLFAGWAWADAELSDKDGYNPTGTFEYDTDGFYGGALAGYNYQWNWLVVGIEGELAWMDLDGDEQDPVFDGAVGRDGDSIASIEAGLYGAITARAGVAFDRVLVYGKGGFAFADVDASFTDDNAAGTTLVSGTSQEDWVGGYTIGGGAEVAVTQNITMRGEYMFTDLGDLDHTATDNLGSTFKFEHDLDDIHTVKVGLSYKF